MESINMGCVSYTNLFLGNGDKLTNSNFKKAMTEAELELQPLVVAYQHAGWDEAIGCSGTIKAAARMLAELGLTDGTITQEGLRKLTRMAIKAGSVQALNLTSISASRAQVIAGGLAVLRAIMRTLDISSMKASQVALREGLIFDMLGKAEHVDIQSQTLANLTNRYSIDISQASRVERTARQLFELVVEPWNLDPETDSELLTWAARLHELGMGVAHTQYHKHGAYILENSDLLGFSLAEQKALALLVRYHRRKIDNEAFNSLPDDERQRLLQLLGLLRLAALLHRGRHDEPLDEISLRIKDGQITVIAPQSWLNEHPLTYAELLAEAERLTHVNIKLKAEKSA
jgi:exopolyphosphatase/guanosine-5'-triphosphate,3'-diphosphate pyrophosphatase